MVCCIWVTLSQWPSVISTLGISAWMGTTYCSHSVSIAQVCRFVLLPSNYKTNYKHLAIHQSFHKTNPRQNINITCWKWCTFHSKRFPSLLIPGTGSDISPIWVKSTWTNSVSTSITPDHLSQPTWTRITILSSNGNLSNWRKRDTSNSAKDHRSSHPRINKCVLITIDQRDKVSDLKNTHWSRSKS